MFHFDRNYIIHRWNLKIKPLKEQKIMFGGPNLAFPCGWMLYTRITSGTVPRL